MARSVYGRDGKQVKGCEDCKSTIEWDCQNCMWRENHWKYSEVNRIGDIVSAQAGGLDVNRLDIEYLDFVKIGLLKKLIEVR